MAQMQDRKIHTEYIGRFSQARDLFLYMQIFTAQRYQIATYTIDVLGTVNLVAGLTLSDSICTPLTYS